MDMTWEGLWMNACLGTYGNFEIMPLMCPGGFDTCTTRLDDRERLRKNNTDGSFEFRNFTLFCSHSPCVPLFYVYV